MRYKPQGNTYFDYAQTDARLRVGLVGHWVGTGSGNTLIDRSGYGNHGTLTNGPTWTQGKIGQGLNFDGVDDYVDAGTSPAGGKTALTISLWVNPRTTGAYMLLEDGIVYDANAFYFYLNNGKPEVEIYSSNYDAFTNTSALPINSWSHVVLVWESGTRIKSYLDGSLASGTQTGTLQTGSLFTGNTTLQFGRRPGGTLIFPGSLDDARIYNRTLSAAEVTLLYNLGNNLLFSRIKRRSFNIISAVAQATYRFFFGA